MVRFTEEWYSRCGKSMAVMERRRGEGGRAKWAVFILGRRAASQQCSAAPKRPSPLPVEAADAPRPIRLLKCSAARKKGGAGLRGRDILHHWSCPPVVQSHQPSQQSSLAGRAGGETGRRTAALESAPPPASFPPHLHRATISVLPVRVPLPICQSGKSNFWRIAA